MGGRVRLTRRCCDAAPPQSEADSREQRPRSARRPYRAGMGGPRARFNFTRDVVEALAADRLRPALTFVDREGIVDRQYVRTTSRVTLRAGRTSSARASIAATAC